MNKSSEAVRLRVSTLCAVFFLLLSIAPTLVAQGSSAVDPAVKEANDEDQDSSSGGVEAFPGPPKEEPKSGEDSSGISQETLDRAVERALQRRSFVVGQTGVELRFGVHIATQWRGGMRNRKSETPRAEFGDTNGFYLERATFSVEADVEDATDHSDFHLATAGIEFGWVRQDLLIERARITFNRPITRFNLPGLKERFTDSLLVGLDDPFFRNDHRVSHSHSLLSEALARDERLQLLWTVTYRKRYYVILGLSDGSKLALDGEVDGSRNFPLLQDDRGDYLSDRESAGATSSRLEWHFGLGAVFDVGNRGQVIHPKRVFRPMDVSKQLDVFHIGAWLTYDTLSADEGALIEQATGTSAAGEEKLRAGVIADLVYESGHNTWYARFEAALARDGELERHFLTLEGSVAIDFGDAMPVLLNAHPFARLSFLQTSDTSPAVSTADVSGSVARNSTLMTANRWQFTGGVAFGFHRAMRLSLEYSVNHESIPTASGDQDLNNNVFMATMEIRF